MPGATRNLKPETSNPAAGTIPTRRAQAGYAIAIAKHPGYVAPKRVTLHTCCICGHQAQATKDWTRYGTIEETYGDCCPHPSCREEFNADIAAGVIHDPDGSWRKLKKGRHCQHRDHPVWHPNAKESEA